MGAEIERHADGVDWRVAAACRPANSGRTTTRRIGHDGAAAELAAALAGILDAAVIAPFAGVVHVGLALFQQLAVAGERVDAFRVGDVRLDFLLDAGFAVGPFDLEAFLGEQAFVIGDELRQSLERRGRFQYEFFHRRLRAAFVRQIGRRTLGLRAGRINDSRMSLAHGRGAAAPIFAAAIAAFAAAPGTAPAGARPFSRSRACRA